MIARALTLFAVLVSFLTVVSRAAAEGELVLVIEPDASLSSALRTSLSSWRVNVEALAPKPELLAASDADADALAQTHGASAVVWLAGESGRGQLRVHLAGRPGFVEHASSDRWPLGSAAAAALALSVKTALRNTPLAPPEERVTTPPPPAPEPQKHDPVKDEPVSAPPVVSTHARGWARLEALAFGRTRAITHGSPVAAFGAALAWYEPYLSGVQLALVADAAWMLAAQHDTQVLHASFRDQRLGAGTRLLWPRLGRVRAELGFSAGVQHSTLHGRELSTAQSFSVARWNPRLAASVGADVRIASFLAVTPRLGLERVLRTQRYHDRTGDVLLSSEPLALVFMLAVAWVVP